MAGDWIKMCVDVPDKPEVWRIAGILSIDADSVVGKLVRVWAWFDSHTIDGNASGVSFALVDRVAGVAGFAEAMALAGWLEQNGHMLTLPNFERHNGKTAKNRALTNERVAKHRALSNADSVTSSVTKTVTREEKRREEINTSSSPTSPSSPVGSDSKRGSRLPEGWEPDEDGATFANEAGIAGQRFRDECAKFRDYWSAQPGAKGRKTDWPATWRNWCRNVQQKPSGPPVPQWKRDQLARIAEFAGPAAAKPRSEAVDVDSRFLD